MQSLINEQITEIEIKKSRFICHLKNVNSEQEAKEYIEHLRTLHPNAAHHCVAYRVGSVVRAYDDGEPSQTAGLPMLNVLEHNQLVNTIAVVVRYFGGTKLGAGGLVRAYTDSVVSALADAQLAKLTPGYILQIKAGYSDVDKINYLLAMNKIDQYNVEYSQNVVYEVRISREKFDLLSSQLNDYNHLIKTSIIEDTIIVEN